jgi:hypothetical protein
MSSPLHAHQAAEAEDERRVGGCEPPRGGDRDEERAVIFGPSSSPAGPRPLVVGGATDDTRLVREDGKRWQ